MNAEDMNDEMCSREEFMKRFIDLQLKNHDMTTEIAQIKIDQAAKLMLEAKFREQERVSLNYKNKIEEYQKKLRKKVEEMRQIESLNLTKEQDSMNRHVKLMDRINELSDKNQKINDSLFGLQSLKTQLEAKLGEQSVSMKELNMLLRQSEIANKTTESKLNLANKEKDKLVKSLQSAGQMSHKVKVQERQITVLSKIKLIAAEFGAFLRDHDLGDDARARNLVQRYARLSDSHDKMLDGGRLSESDSGMGADSMLIDIPTATTNQLRMAFSNRPNKPVVKRVTSPKVVERAIKAVKPVKKKAAKRTFLDPRDSAFTPKLSASSVDPAKFKAAILFSKQLRDSFDPARKIMPMIRPSTLSSSIARRRAPGTNNNMDIVPTRIQSRPNKPGGNVQVVSSPSALTPTVSHTCIISSIVKQLVNDIVLNLDGPAKEEERTKMIPAVSTQVSITQWPPIAHSSPIVNSPIIVGSPKVGIKARLIGSGNKRSVVPPRTTPVISKSSLDLSNLMNHMEMGVSAVLPVESSSKVEIHAISSECKSVVEKVVCESTLAGTSFSDSDFEGGLVIDDSQPQPVEQPIEFVKYELATTVDSAASLSPHKKRRCTEKETKNRKSDADNNNKSPAKKMKIQGEIKCKERKISGKKKEVNDTLGVRTKPIRPGTKAKTFCAAKLPSVVTPLGASHHTQIAKRVTKVQAARKDEKTVREPDFVPDICEKSVFSILELPGTGSQKLAMQIIASFRDVPCKTSVNTLARFVVYGLAPKCGDMMARFKVGSPPPAPFLAESENRFMEVLADMKTMDCVKYDPIYSMLSSTLYPKCFQLDSHNPPQILSSLRILTRICVLAKNSDLLEVTLKQLLMVKPPEITCPAFLFICAVDPKVFVKCFTSLTMELVTLFRLHVMSYRGRLSIQQFETILQHYCHAMPSNVFAPVNDVNAEINVCRMTFENCSPMFYKNESSGQMNLRDDANVKLLYLCAVIRLVSNNTANHVVCNIYGVLMEDLDNIQQMTSKEFISAKIIMLGDLFVGRPYALSVKKLVELLKKFVFILEKRNEQSEDWPVFLYSISHFVRKLTLFPCISQYLMQFVHKIAMNIGQ